MKYYMLRRKKKETRKLNLLEGTTILAVLTTLIYTLAFSYKAGYHSYFDVPLFYLSFDIRNNIDSVMWVVLYFIIILASIMCVNTISTFLEFTDKKMTSLKKKVNKKAIGAVCLAISILLLIYLFFYELKSFLLVAGIIFSITCCRMTYSYIRKSFGKYMAHFFIMLLVLIFVCIFVYSVGYLNASIQEDFYVINLNDELFIILGVKDEKYILMEYNTELNLLSQQYNFISVESDLIKSISFEGLDQPPKLRKE